MGCTWRTLLKPFGNWHTIYTRLNQWSENGVLDRLYAALSAKGLKADRVFGLDSMAVKTRPDAHGARKKRRSGDRQDARRLETLESRRLSVDLAMNRAYSDDLTRMTAWLLRYNPVVPPKRNRKNPWAHDAELYKKRNEVERFLRRLKTYRAVATRYDKLDLMFSASIWIACICILLRSVNMP